MTEAIYTIVNPIKFMTHYYFKDKLIRFGFPVEAVSIKLIKKEDMAIEIELYFKIIEVGNKFYEKFNGKSFGVGNNYKLNIKKGKSNKIDENPETKEIKYIHNYSSWNYTHYAIKKDEEGLILINPSQKDIQKNMISHIISKINNTYIKGQDIMKFRFPIQLYDKRTILQVLAYELREAPYILNKVNFIIDPIEKLKYMTTFIISQLYLSVIRIKPIEPLLGETYQVKIANLNCYLEQTNTDPAITHIYCFDTDNLYKIYGYISIKTKIGINNLKILKSGNLYVEFINGNKYKIYYPSYYIGGITLGKKNFNIINSSLILDLTNRLVSYINFVGPKHDKNVFNRPDYFIGKLISINEINIDEKKGKHKIVEEDTIPLAEFDGEWTKGVIFNDNYYWKRKEDNLAKMYEMKNILKSDSSLREDLKLYNENKIEEAEKYFKEYQKNELNDIQLRLKYKNK